MATAAAPTFSPAYRIPAKGVFVDGAVQAGKLACHEACCYVIPREEIFMRSMGIGAYISDLLPPDLKGGEWFWVGTFAPLNLALQTGDAYKQMLSNLEGCYQ